MSGIYKNLRKSDNTISLSLDTILTDSGGDRGDYFSFKMTETSCALFSSRGFFALQIFKHKSGKIYESILSTLDLRQNVFYVSIAIFCHLRRPLRHIMSYSKGFVLTEGLYIV